MIRIGTHWAHTILSDSRHIVYYLTFVILITIWPLLRCWECGSRCKMSQSIKHELMDWKWKDRYDAIPRMYFGWIGNFSWQPFILQYDLWTQPICSVICDFDVAPIMQIASTACPIWVTRTFRSDFHVFIYTERIAMIWHNLFGFFRWPPPQNFIYHLDT